MKLVRRSLPVAVVLALAAGLTPSAAEAPAPSAPVVERAQPPLAGVRIALDPGHQLGNHRYPREINRLVPAGGFRKACNTTGTSTNAGFPEATFNWRVATRVKARLEKLGATVLMTRTSNRQDRWGPCVNVRGQFGERVRARLTVSLHGDGASASARGFHVIVPKSRRPWTSDIAVGSARLGRQLRAGLDRRSIPRSTYIGRGTAMSVRSDLGTLNMSDVPIAMVEFGNMRNRADARRMTSASGREVYAAAIVSGVRGFLDR